MITSNIGRLFLDEYNKRNKTRYNAKDFFLEVFYPLVFGYNKYMVSGGNSPLENPKISWGDCLRGKKTYETKEERQTRLNRFVEKVDNGVPEAGIAMGFPTTDVLATTSGQTTSMVIGMTADDAYLSWIGGCLGIGVQGGVCLLINNVDILYDTFDGWQYYRKYLEDYPLLKGNQINTWNGKWIAHRYNEEEYDSRKPLASFSPLNKAKDDTFDLATESWLDVMYGVATQQKTTIQMAYIYSLGQMNDTIGFIPFYLSDILEPFELYQRIFACKNIDQVKKLLATDQGLVGCCRMGCIGLLALQPNGMRDLLSGKSSPNYKPNNEPELLKFNVYQIYLLAMLNNEQMWEEAHTIAKDLLDFAASDKKAKTTKANKVNEVLTSTSKKAFIESLTNVIKEFSIENDNQTAKFDKLGELVHKMPTENVPYFLTLIRFKYAVLNN